jgi:hypothetical protein
MRGSRVGPVLLCSLALLTALFSPGAAGSTAIPGHLSVSRLAVSSLAARNTAQARARTARLKSSRARNLRLRSRVAYRHLDGHQALTLYRRTFGIPAPIRAVAPRPGVRRLRAVSTTSEIVSNEHGKREMLVSSTPLSVDTPNGKRPLDLSVNETGGTFRPRASGAPVSISSQVSKGVSFAQKDFAVSLESSRDAAPLSTAGTVFWPNVATDTDYQVTPTVAGIESFLSLRSQNSPESFRFKVALPPGATLQHAVSDHPIPNDPPRSLVIMSSGGDPLGYINPVFAVDAAGTLVPAEMRINGDGFVVEVGHRGADIQYPVRVDPLISVYANGSDWSGWQWGQSRTNSQGTDSNFGMAVNDCNYMCGGLYQSMPTNAFFSAGDFAQYYWFAPPGTYLYEMAFGYWGHQPYYSNAINGVFDPATGNWAANTTYVNASGGIGGNPWTGNFAVAFAQHTYCRGAGGTATNPTCDGSLPPDGTYAAMALQVNNNGAWVATQNNRAWSSMGYAYEFLGDRYAPAIASVSTPSSAWSNVKSFTSTAHLTDTGLGVAAMTVSGGATQTSGYSAGCNGDPYHSACPHDVPTAQVSYTLPEGTSQSYINVTDAFGNLTSRYFSASVDSVPPAITDSSGYLTDANGQLTAGVRYDIGVTATDSGSGLSRIALLIDGSEVDSGPCDRTGSCTVNLAYQPSAAAAGTHIMQTVAYDQANNPARSPSSTEVVDATPITSTEHETPDVEMNDDVQPSDYDDPAVMTDGNNPNGYCDPNSTDPAVQCDAPVAQTSADRAASNEPALALNQSTPLLLGASLGTGTRSAPGPGVPKDLNRGGTGWGLADEKVNLFTQTAPGSSTLAIDDLSVGRVRKIIAFDAVLRANQTTTYNAATGGNCGSSGTVTVPQSNDSQRELDGWLQANLSAGGYEPLISFQLSKGDNGKQSGHTFDRVRCALPTLTQYSTAVQAVLDRYRRMRNSAARPLAFTAWNEPNNGSQPTHDTSGMRRAGEYYTVLRRLCAQAKYGCTVAAGDLLDDRTILTHIEDYKQGVRYRSGNSPAVWAIHPYGLARIADPSARQARLTKYVKATIGDTGSAKLWFTESGGRFDGPTRTPAKAQNDFCRVIALARSDNHVSRYYQYELDGAGVLPSPGKFDTGLLNSDGTSRALYNAYRYFSAKTGSTSC